MTATSRLPRSLAILVSAATVLTGCGQPPPIFARVDGDDVVVVICASYERPALALHTSTLGTSGSHRVWRIESPTTTTSGDQVVLGRVPVGWSADVPFSVASWDGLAITVGLFEKEGSGAYTTASFIPDRMTEGEWYESGGGRAEPSCEPEPLD